MNQIVLVTFTDWQALFLNNDKVDEAHEIEDLPRFMAEHQPFIYRVDQGDEPWLIDLGSFLPDDLASVKIYRKGQVIGA